ncbi:MAG: PKD domain-containing protein, partial [Verrucomicrobia bacterium]|nr:PKD domain-containing protein [Verrucomicrobiota bacterium]
MKLELDGFVPCLIGFVTLTVVVTGVVPAYGVQVPQGYWQFDGDGNDGSGHNLALEMNGGLSFVQGLFAQALDLPRDNNKFAYRPVDDGILDFGASNFTIQVWVNYHSTGGEQVLIEKFQGQTGPGWTLTKLSGNEFRFHANPAIILTSPSQTITTSVWHQVVVRRNGTSIDILFDANRIAIGNAGTTPISDASNGLLIGRRNSGDWNNYSMNGMLDEIAIWTCALSDAEINLLYNGGSGRPVRQSVSIGSPRRSGEILAGDALRFAAYRADWQDLGPFVLRWDFGDGHSSALENPGIVNLVGTGTKAVTLYVTDNQGQQDPNPDTRTITVLPATNSIPDLAVTQLNVPGNLAIGQPAAITYAVRNAGDGKLSGKSWKDALYLSRDAYLDVNDRLLVSAAVSNNVAVGGSYTNTLTATLPAVEEGAYYLLLSVNDEWQFLERHRLNNEFSVATDLVIPRLTNAAPFTASLSGNGDEQYFRIDVPAGQNLLIQLDDADNQGANEVYVRFGALPSRGTFDFRAATPSRADQQLLIPAAAPGTYYILIHGESVPGNGQFTL